METGMLRDEEIKQHCLASQFALSLIYINSCPITRASKILINSSKGIFQLKIWKLLTKLNLNRIKILKIICLMTYCIVFIHVKKKIYTCMTWLYPEWNKGIYCFLYSEMLCSISRLVIPHQCSISNWWCALSLWKRKEFLKSNLLYYFLAYWIKQDVTGILFIVMICIHVLHGVCCK